MKIAVTGATGHVGITLCKALIADHYDVVGFYRNEAKTEPLKTLNMQLCQGDVLDASFLEQHLADVDVVINLAAMISIDGDPNGTVMKTNIEGPRNIVNCCEKLGIKQLIHFSSIHSLKYNADDDVVNEETPFYSGNKFSYKLSKAKGEQEAHKAVDKGIHLTVFRPTSIIGPNDYAPSEVGEILLNLYHGKMPSLLKTGFDWVDVRDIVTATIAALNIGSRPSGEVYMLSGHWHSLKELSLMGSAATGKKNGDHNVTYLGRLCLFTFYTSD